MFIDCIMKTISSDVESCEEQDGGKHYFVGQMTAKLQAILQVYVAKNTEKKLKPKILTLLKKAAFFASFAGWDYQNRNFMMSNTIVILLLLASAFRTGKVFLEACAMEPVFWLMRFGCTIMQRQKSGLCRLKG